jgi:hypothetical protein
LAVVALLAVAPAPADASPPVLDSVTVPLGGLRPTLTWHLPDGVRALFVEASTSPAVNEDGYLGERTNVSFNVLGPSQTEYTDDHDYAPGIYYVHVAGHDKTCVGGACPQVEFSRVVRFRIPGVPFPELVSVGQSGDRLTASWTLPDGYEPLLIEVSRTRDTYPNGRLAGAFLDEDLVLWEGLDPGATSYLSAAPLAPGSYYVHLAVLDDTLCDDPDSVDCIVEFTAIAPVTINAPVHGDVRPPPPRTVPPADVVTSFSALKCSSRQKVGSLTVQAGMAENGTITVTGTVNVPNAAKVYKLKSVSVTALAGRAVTVRLKLPKKALKAAKKALKRHKKVKASLTITARDTAGNVKTEKRSVKLKR